MTMKIISSGALDRFFFYSSNRSMLIKQMIQFYEIGDFVYYDCDEIRGVLKPKAKALFDDFLQRNPFQVHEYHG